MISSPDSPEQRFRLSRELLWCVGPYFGAAILFQLYMAVTRLSGGIYQLNPWAAFFDIPIAVFLFPVVRSFHALRTFPGNHSIHWSKLLPYLIIFGVIDVAAFIIWKEEARLTFGGFSSMRIFYYRLQQYGFSTVFPIFYGDVISLILLYFKAFSITDSRTPFGNRSQHPIQNQILWAFGPYIAIPAVFYFVILLLANAGRSFFSLFPFMILFLVPVGAVLLPATRIYQTYKVLPRKSSAFDNVLLRSFAILGLYGIIALLTWSDAKFRTFESGAFSWPCHAVTVPLNWIALVMFPTFTADLVFLLILYVLGYSRRVAAIAVAAPEIVHNDP